VFCGSAQAENGSDGIGDSAYFINENNIDHYPFMEDCPVLDASYPLDPSVGGTCTHIHIPISKPESPTPYIIASTILVLTAIIAIYAKRKLE